MPAECEIDGCGVLAVGRCLTCNSGFCATHQGRTNSGNTKYTDCCSRCARDEMTARQRARVQSDTPASELASAFAKADQQKAFARTLASKKESERLARARSLLDGYWRILEDLPQYLKAQPAKVPLTWGANESVPEALETLGSFRTSRDRPQGFKKRVEHQQHFGQCSAWRFPVAKRLPGGGSYSCYVSADRSVVFATSYRVGDVSFVTGAPRTFKKLSLQDQRTYLLAWAEPVHEHHVADPSTDNDRLTTFRDGSAVAGVDWLPAPQQLAEAVARRAAG